MNAGSSEEIVLSKQKKSTVYFLSYVPSLSRPCSLSSLFDFAPFSERTSPLIDLAGAGKGVLHSDDRNPFQEQTIEWVTLEYSSPKSSANDWIGVFSPANFNASTCLEVNPRVYPPRLCSAPIKYQFANYSSPEYKDTGKGYLKLQLINQRSDFSFALFSGGLSNVFSQMLYRTRVVFKLAALGLHTTSKVVMRAL